MAFLDEAVSWARNSCSFDTTNTSDNLNLYLEENMGGAVQAAAGYNFPGVDSAAFELADPNLVLNAGPSDDQPVPQSEVPQMANEELYDSLAHCYDQVEMEESGPAPDYNTILTSDGLQALFEDNSGVATIIHEIDPAPLDSVNTAGNVETTDFSDGLSLFLEENKRDVVLDATSSDFPCVDHTFLELADFDIDANASPSHGQPMFPSEDILAFIAESCDIPTPCSDQVNTSALVLPSSSPSPKRTVQGNVPLVSLLKSKQSENQGDQPPTTRESLHLSKAGYNHPESYYEQVKTSPAVLASVAPRSSGATGRSVPLVSILKSQQSRNQYNLSSKEKVRNVQEVSYNSIPPSALGNMQVLDDDDNVFSKSAATSLPTPRTSVPSSSMHTSQRSNNKEEIGKEGMEKCSCQFPKMRQPGRHHGQCPSCKIFWCTVGNCSVEYPSKSRITRHITALHPEAWKQNYTNCGNCFNHRKPRDGSNIIMPCPGCGVYWCLVENCQLEYKRYTSAVEHQCTHQ